MDDSWFYSLQIRYNCFFSETSRTVLRPAQRPVQWYRRSSPGAERTEREVDHKIPSSAEAKNKGNYTSAHPMRLYGEDRDNFTSYIYIYMR